jgi:hypothetical protein
MADVLFIDVPLWSEIDNLWWLCRAEMLDVTRDRAIGLADCADATDFEALFLGSGVTV